MRKLRFKRDRPSEIVPATGAAAFTVEPDQVVEVDENTAESLLAQSDVWEEAKPAKSDKEKT